MNKSRIQLKGGFKWSIRLALVCISIFFFLCESTSQNNSSIIDDSSKKAKQMAQKLHKGVVLDVTPSSEGMPVKFAYDPMQLDAIKDAGFQSIRIYVVAMRNPTIYKTIINDALDRGLAVVISLWGDYQWTKKSEEEGIQDFVDSWEKYAKYYKDYPDELVFDLLNEPAGMQVLDGKPSGITDGKLAMRYLNAVIPEIRKTNPNRILGIGGPGLNEAKNLEEFVTPEYLNYQLTDSTGFQEDENIIGLFHMYVPGHFSHWTLPLSNFPNWKNEIRKDLDYVVSWSDKWQKPVVMTEWGAWAPPSHSTSDFKKYLQYIVDECKKDSIFWMYYTAGFNNQWGFNILNTDKGWNTDAVEILTGMQAPQTPALSAIINSEFGWSTESWNSKGTANISVNWNANLSGSTALNVKATESNQAEVYQQTTTWSGSPPNRYLISMSKGKIYKVSFLAKALGSKGTLKVRFSNASKPGDGFWTSEPIEILNYKNEYLVEYKHTSNNVNDVRLSFMFEDKNQTVLLDRIALRGYADTLGTSINSQIRSIDKCIYPNPTTGILNISNSGDYSIYVYNLQGAKMAGFSKLSNDETIDLSSLPKGAYLTLIDSGKCECERIKLLIQ